MTADELEIIAKTVREQTLLMAAREADAMIESDDWTASDVQALEHFAVWLREQASRA
jgi:hypothetical protein